MGQLQLVLAALFGGVVGQAVLFYMGTFYAYYFLERVAHVDAFTVTVLTGAALVIAAPLVVVSGWLSDRIGRKPLLLGAVALAALLYFPLFGALLSAANPELARHARPRRSSSSRIPPIARCSSIRSAERATIRSSCDVVKSYLAHAGISHATRALPAPGPARLEVGGTALVAPDAATLAGKGRAEAIATFQSKAGAALDEAGYRAKADPAKINRPRVLAILVLLLAFAAAALGAYAALLAEMFPSRIRYTALAFPQNLGNGWFGGLLPAITFTIVAATGNVFAGLWYPVSVAALSLLVGWLALPETRGRPIA